MIKSMLFLLILQVIFYAQDTFPILPTLTPDQQLLGLSPVVRKMALSLN